MKPVRYLLFFSLMDSLVSFPPAFATTPFISCSQDKARMESRSKELQILVQADQADRGNWNTKSPDEMNEVLKRDETRRKRVGEIFGEGCFSQPEDYAAAALIYQHGNTPDHFFQTYIWSKRAVDLGDPHQSRMMALGIDRYLVNIGQKQLFGSQATKPNSEPCWCLQEVEMSFPDQRRTQYAGKSYLEALAWLKELNAGKICPNKECTQGLKPTPKGTVPGLW